MTKNTDKPKAIIARIVEYNTGGSQPETIDRAHIGTVAGHNSKFPDGELDAAISDALEAGLLKEPAPGQYVATEKVVEVIPGK